MAEIFDGEIVREQGAVRIVLSHIGEGYGGDYDSDDTDDKPLLRLDVFEPSEDCPGEWEYVDKSSVCTNVPATLPKADLDEIANRILSILVWAKDHYSLKLAAAELSWFDEDWRTFTYEPAYPCEFVPPQF